MIFPGGKEKEVERNRDDSYDLRLQSTKVMCVWEREGERERDRQRERAKEKLQTQWERETTNNLKWSAPHLPRHHDPLVCSCDLQRSPTNVVRERKPRRETTYKCSAPHLSSAEASWAPGVLVWLAEDPYKCQWSERHRERERERLGERERERERETRRETNFNDKCSDKCSAPRLLRQHHHNDDPLVPV